jgi:hypothetical protein
MRGFLKAIAFIFIMRRRDWSDEPKAHSSCSARDLPISSTAATL